MVGEMWESLTSSDYAIIQLVTGFTTYSPFRDIATQIGCHEAALRLIFSLLLGQSLVSCVMVYDRPFSCVSFAAVVHKLLTLSLVLFFPGPNKQLIRSASFTTCS